jgi:hypothetical protein
MHASGSQALSRHFRYEIANTPRGLTGSGTGPTTAQEVEPQEEVRALKETVGAIRGCK